MTPPVSRSTAYRRRKRLAELKTDLLLSSGFNCPISTSSSTSSTIETKTEIIQINDTSDDSIVDSKYCLSPEDYLCLNYALTSDESDSESEKDYLLKQAPNDSDSINGQAKKEKAIIQDLRDELKLMKSKFLIQNEKYKKLKKSRLATIEENKRQQNEIFQLSIELKNVNDIREAENIGRFRVEQSSIAGIKDDISEIKEILKNQKNPMLDINEEVVPLYENCQFKVHNFRYEDALASTSYKAFAQKILTALFSYNEVMDHNLCGYNRNHSKKRLAEASPDLDLWPLKKAVRQDKLNALLDACEHYYSNEFDIKQCRFIIGWKIKSLNACITTENDTKFWDGFDSEDFASRKKKEENKQLMQRIKQRQA